MREVTNLFKLGFLFRAFAQRCTEKTNVFLLLKELCFSRYIIKASNEEVQSFVHYRKHQEGSWL